MEDFNSLYKQSCDLVMPYIHLEGVEEEPFDEKVAEENLRKGIDGFSKVLGQHPDNWTAHWMLGKAHQALGEHAEAYQAFLDAHDVNLGDENILRELALECLQLQRFDLAVYYCQVAQEFDPIDPTLIANMAVAKLFQNKLEEAENWANKCLAKIPNDYPSSRVLHIIQEVKSGIRSVPTHLSELEE